MGNKQEEASGHSDEIISKGTVYERIRLALEELGPTFVKLVRHLVTGRLIAAGIDPGVTKTSGQSGYGRYGCGRSAGK